MAEQQTPEPRDLASAVSRVVKAALEEREFRMKFCVDPHSPDGEGFVKGMVGLWHETDAALNELERVFYGG